MSKAGVERKLTTILCADVVGYSRLMGEDEEATLGRLKTYRAKIEDSIAAHRGRVFGGAGDSMVAEFASPVEAVRCAVEIQRGLAGRNADLAEDRRMLFRIGLHLGDVMVDGDDLLGDGVNVAARLESMAEPGGVCLSGPVHDQVSRRLDVEIRPLGPQRLKNMAEPVAAYSIAPDAPAAAPKREGRRFNTSAMAAMVIAALAVAVAVWAVWLRPAPVEVAVTDERPSIIVLPFDNLSGDPGEDHIADGISEDLTTDLSRVGGLFVFSRNIAGDMKPRIAPGRRESVDPTDVAGKLGANYVLEGSVRRSGNMLRINAQLIDGKTGGHLWAERYDRDSKDVFVVLDEVILKIVAALKVRLTPGERDALADARTVNPDAWDLVLRGVVKLRRYTRDTNKEAETLFRRAVEFDPDYARAHANVALSLSIRLLFGWADSPEATIEEALRFAEKAQAIDDSVEQVHIAFASIYLRKGMLDKAIESGERIVELNPGNPDGYAVLAVALGYSGGFDECLSTIGEATRRNPNGPFYYIWIEGQCLFMLERYDEALKQFEEVAGRNPEFIGNLRFLAATQAHLGRTDDAEWTAEEILTIEPDDTLAKEREWLSYIRKEDIERYIEGLRLAGIPE
jgi:TolB-like protein/class 3 adenylate cyclase/Flp pilus assembly protein TadD